MRLFHEFCGEVYTGGTGEFCFAFQFSAGQGASGFGGEFPACSFLDTKRADNVRDGISEITEESDRSPIISTAP